LPVVSHWDNNEDLCTACKTEHIHHISRFLLVPGLTTIFWIGELGVEDNLNGLRQVPILRHVIYFCVAEPKTMSAHQSQEHKMSWNNKLEIIS
jgi:hypothetical protein